MNASTRRAWAIAEVIIGSLAVLTTKWATGMDWAVWFALISGMAVFMIGLSKLAWDRESGDE